MTKWTEAIARMICSGLPTTTHHAPQFRATEKRVGRTGKRAQEAIDRLKASASNGSHASKPNITKRGGPARPPTGKRKG